MAESGGGMPGFKSLKRKQKPLPPQISSLDIMAALPDVSNFRQSLIMPGMTARFSMLREQDDPTTKIGKASDDSVLFPNRASRLNLFKHNPLTDIAEVESIYSFRPPFADGERHSISEGYTSEDGGSIMSRPKQIDGNNLFGGRQKVYRIPASTDSMGSIGEGRGGGRHVYQNDVSASAFREQSRGRKASVDQDTLRDSMPDAEEPDQISSPMTPFSKNRDTSSSTASRPSNGRASTAATSVGSESPAMAHANASNRALSTTSRQSGTNPEPAVPPKPVPAAFEFQSDPPVAAADSHNATQQPWRRPSSKSTQRLSQSRSATSLSERYIQSARQGSASATRNISPPPSHISPVKTVISSLREEGRSPSPRIRTGSPTLALTDGDSMSNLDNILEPNDRGKATAMGIFKRPQRQFDEQQFSQRQLQMVEGRSSPASGRELESRSESRTSPDPKPISNGPSPEPVRAQPVIEPFRSFSRPSVESKRSTQGSKFDQSRETNPVRTTSGLSDRQRKSSASAAGGASNMKAKLESLIRQQNAELSELENDLVPPPHQHDSIAHKSIASSTDSFPAHGTFFDMQDDEDEDEDDVEDEAMERKSVSVASTGRKSASRSLREDLHPALRDGLNDFVFSDPVPSPQIQLPKLPFEDSDEHTDTVSSPITTPLTSPTMEKHEDSPTLPAPGLGLSGMMKHLRTDSDKSSLYPQPSPTLPVGPPIDVRKVSTTSTNLTNNASESARSDPWELDSAQNQSSNPRSPLGEHHDAAEIMSQRALAVRDQAEALKHHQQARSKAQRILGEDAPVTAGLEPLEAPNRPWQEEIQPFHQRNGSSMTAKSRQDFDDEVAQARKRVQQRLKNDIRERGQPHHFDPSLPSPDFNVEPMEHGRPRRPSRPNEDGSAAPYEQQQQQQQPSKAMRMLGIQGPPPQQSRPRGPPPGPPSRGGPGPDERWREEEERMLRDFGVRPKQRTPPRDDEFQGRPPRPPYGPPYRTGSEEDVERQRQRSATPNSGQRPRHRANSEAAHRSTSRTGGEYHDGEDERERERVPSRMRNGYGNGYGHPPPSVHHGGRGYNESRSPPRHRYYRAPSRGDGEYPPRSQHRGPPPSHAGAYERSMSAASGRYRNDSRAQTPNGSYPDRERGRDRDMTQMRPSIDSPGYPAPGMGRGDFAAPRPSPRIPSDPTQSPLASPRPIQSAFDSSSPIASGANSPTVPPRDISRPRPPPSVSAVSSSGRTTPGLGNRNASTTPPPAQYQQAGRKKSVTKGMISDPTLISTTSSVPLVGLPSPHDTDPEGNSPPVPSRNPDRANKRSRPTLTPTASGGNGGAAPPHNPFQYLRADLRPVNSGSASVGTTPTTMTHPQTQPQGSNGNNSSNGYHNFSFPGLSAKEQQVPLSASAVESRFPHSPIERDGGNGVIGLPANPRSGTMPIVASGVAGLPRAKNRLRKVSSEGGNMASRARRERMAIDGGVPSPRLAQHPVEVGANEGGMF